MDRQTSFSLPSPADTPYRTPSSSLSRRSHYEDMSPSSTPPPLPTDLGVVKKRSHDSQMALDETLSPLDPRRFTPTLHASLVSEILSLRRDLENKTKSIEQLEQSLHTAQSQNEGLSKSLLTSNKDVRSIKRQMQLLEGGTLSALNDLSKERDDAVKTLGDVRKHLEQFQRRAKTHEQNADNTQALWEQDKESWAAEKRSLETKAHIAESRLKAVLDEVTKAQAESVRPESVARGSGGRIGLSDSPTIIPSPDMRHRSYSEVSMKSEHNGGRVSGLSLVHGHTTNLADELALDDIDEDSADEDVHDGGRISPDALPEENPRSPSSLSNKARKVLGLAIQFEMIPNPGRPEVDTDTTLERTIAPNAQKQAYVDSAVQYSLPPSPVQNTARGSHAVVNSSITKYPASASLREMHLDTPIMVSSSCQTLEYLPSPPATPKQEDNHLVLTQGKLEDKAETREMSTQTEIIPRPGGSRYMHSRTSTHDLGIPIIAIIPPTSRPTTPETHVMLPPQTKNAACQVDSRVLSNYTNTSMQTEEIRIDRRNMFLTQLPANLPGSNQSVTTSKGKASVYPWRGSSQVNQPVSNSSLKRTAPQNISRAPVNDDGPLATDSSLASSRPVRSSSLFAGFDDYVEEVGEDFECDIFYEDDYSSRPTAKFTLRSGKLVSQENALEDIGEVMAVSAGEAIALDNLKKSETTLPPELRQFDLPERSTTLQRQSTIRRATSTSNQSSVRRAALMTSGVVAHQSKLSQSTAGSGSLEGSIPPPIPIPLRYSSAKFGKSYSESGRNSRGSSHNTSPTRQYRSKYRPVLRKARSGPAISPAGQSRRPRSKSPPLDSRVSIVPEMPVFQMPTQSRYDPQPSLINEYQNATQEASAPRPAVATGPRRSHNHLKQVSDPTVLQQTSVVDAIAQTMVGEWMYKYVRRRKSFGKPDKDWDPNKSVEELTSNPASAGVRHKRWVWLAPYERAVMWSSKQPMNGIALLGKSGRKLTVKSVLDVKDDNPMPKNSLTGPAFNRSILILTPQRALKFTATNQERHFIWLTALSFLSHSPLSIGDLAALPPPPDENRSLSPVPAEGSFRRRTLRDSIRIAKGPSRHQRHRSNAESSANVEINDDTRPPTQEIFDLENDAALPPTVRRFHTRNRSNTAPRPLQSSFVSFSQRDVPSASYHNNNYPETGQNMSGIASSNVPTSRRGSEASAFPRPAFTNTHTANQFVSSVQPGVSVSDTSHNASMTMRMNAFMDHKQVGRGNFKNLRLGGASRPTNKDLSYWGIEETTSPISPVDSFTPRTTTSVRLSDSTDRGTVERDFFRGF